jgi:hypothetical protein
VELLQQHVDLGAGADTMGVVCLPADGHRSNSCGNRVTCGGLLLPAGGHQLRPQGALLAHGLKSIDPAPALTSRWKWPGSLPRHDRALGGEARAAIAGAGT